MNNTLNYLPSVGYVPSVGIPGTPSVGTPSIPSVSITPADSGYNPFAEESPDPDTHLTEHFTLREFIRSATAIRKDIANMPSDDEIARLKALCVNVLEPLRRRFGVIRITSGYRCGTLNKLVGGSPTSQHILGEAADIHCGSTEIGKKMYDYIFNNLDFDQMLLEFRGTRHPHIHCLHISYRSDRGKNRHKCTSNYII